MEKNANPTTDDGKREIDALHDPQINKSAACTVTARSAHDHRFGLMTKATQMRVVRLLLFVILTLSLAACSVPSVSISINPTAVPSTAAPNPTLPPSSSASATTPPATAASTPAAAATAAGATSPNSTAEAAIKSVIQRANQEEQQAFAAHDPTLMRDTATITYYDDLVQGFNNLMSSNVTAIQLLKLDWGTIALQGATNAQATTLETWSTTFANGGTLQQTDVNVYTMVLQNGAWKVQDDQHPDSRLLQPPPGSSGTAPTSVAPVAPTGPTAVAPVAPAAQGQSRNWAGFAATGGTFTAVSGAWTVPNVSAGSTPGADATWVGIGGVGTTDLIQAGTDSTVQGGRVVYTAWMETLPQASQTVPLAVGAGDSVSVSITQQANGAWQILIRNTTTGQTYQQNVTYSSSRSSAEWIEESPAVGRRLLLPLDNFGKVTFTNATTVENGQQRSIAQAGGQAITMYNAAEQPLAQPSALSANGTSFTVTRTNAPATRITPGTGILPRRRVP